MLANVNIGKVQPSGRVEHLKHTEAESDKVPILHSEVLETIHEAEAPDESEGDGISVTSMDMLLDREKMGSDAKTNYGAAGPSN